MPLPPHSARVAISFAIAASLPTLACAQMPKPDEVAVSTSLSGIYQFDTDPDHGGDFHFAAGIASGTMDLNYAAAPLLGLTLSHRY